MIIAVIENSLIKQWKNASLSTMTVGWTFTEESARPDDINELFLAGQVTKIAYNTICMRYK